MNQLGDSSGLLQSTKCQGNVKSQGILALGKSMFSLNKESENGWFFCKCQGFWKNDVCGNREIDQF